MEARPKHNAAPPNCVQSFSFPCGKSVSPSTARTTRNEGCPDGMFVRFLPSPPTAPPPIVWPFPGCHPRLMRPPTPSVLTPGDKINALQRLDEFHFWHSLNDVRVCQRCHHQITGWQIEVFEIPGTHGSLRLYCPTPSCESSPVEWVYADPVLVAKIRSHAPASRPGLVS
jgi:hypothetical protein